MNKAAVAVLKAALVVGALTSLPIFYGLLSGLGARPINDAVYPALRKIEAACLAESIPTVRCRTVLEQVDDCESGERCTIDRHYCAVFNAGFGGDLPPLYRDRQPPDC
jgi:hypothetical protein